MERPHSLLSDHLSFIGEIGSRLNRVFSVLSQVRQRLFEVHKCFMASFDALA